MKGESHSVFQNFNYLFVLIPCHKRKKVFALNIYLMHSQNTESRRATIPFVVAPYFFHFFFLFQVIYSFVSLRESMWTGLEVLKTL